MRVCAAKTVCFEMCTVRRESRNLRTERADREVVSPDLTVVGTIQNLCLERGLAVDSWSQSYKLKENQTEWNVPNE